MFHSNFNSIYLRPTASGTIDGWNNATAAEKHWDNINDQIFFEGNTPPRADYAGFPPAEIINYTHPYLGTKDGQYAHVKIYSNGSANYFGEANSGQVQSWMFEKPQFEGSGQLNIWMYATSLFTINNQSTNIISYSKLDNNWVPRQINNITRFDTFFNTSQTGVFRWYKIPVGVYTSGAFVDFEVGLSYTNVVNSAPYPTIEAIYAEVEVNPGFPLYTLGAYPSQTGTIPIVVGRPADDSSSGVPLFIEGIPYYSSGNLTLYTDAVYQENDIIPFYINGGFYGSSGAISLYTSGPIPAESGLGFILYNNNPLTTGLTLYVNTYDIKNSGIDLYAFGAYLSNQSVPLYVLAPDGTNNSLPLYTSGNVPTPITSGISLYTNSDDPFRDNGWTSYNALYDYYNTYIPVSKNRVKYGTFPFDSPLPYSGIYNFFRPHIASGVQYTYYDPSRAVWDNGNWSRGMFVSGVIAFGNPSGFNIAVTLPNVLYDIDDATYFFTPYIPDMGDNVLSSVMHEPFTQYLEQYFDPYNLIDFKSFVDDYFESNHPAYKSSIDSWNGIIVQDLAGQQTYFLTAMSGNTGIWPALPVSAYHNAVASSIAYVESLSNPHHPYTFPFYTAGANIVSYNATLYTKGLSYPASTGIPLFAKVSINGEANVKDTDGSVSLYTSALGIRGSSFRGMELYLNNAQTYLSLSDQFTLYVQSEQPIYSESDSLDLYLRNNLEGVYSGIPLYTANIREGVSIFDPEYFTLADNAYPLSTSRTLYLHNNNQGGSLPIYLNVSDRASGNMPMYILGGNIGQTGISLYTKSYGIDTDTLKLYTHGY